MARPCENYQRLQLGVKAKLMIHHICDAIRQVTLTCLAISVTFFSLKKILCNIFVNAPNDKVRTFNE
jgi:hypothetical protein